MLQLFDQPHDEVFQNRKLKGLIFPAGKQIEPTTFYLHETNLTAAHLYDKVAEKPGFHRKAR